LSSLRRSEIFVARKIKRMIKAPYEQHRTVRIDLYPI
jgi:hypothetical protein